MDAHDHGSLPVKEAFYEEALAGVVAWRCLALAIAGTFCALASVAEAAGQSSETSSGLWGSWGEACWSDKAYGTEMRPNAD